MAAPAADDDDFFSPSNDRLVDRYLRAKLDGRLSDLAKAARFLDADVCSARPQDLVRTHSMPAHVAARDAGDGKQFYFFSPARFVGTTTTTRRRSRTIDGTGDKESWHAEGRPKPVEGSACGGYITKFSYHVRIGPKTVEKPGWIMAEYAFKDTGAGDTVLCKVYKSPRGPGRSTSSCTSSAKSGCKRKAADDLEEATSRSSTRPRHTNQDEDDVTLFAGDLELDLLSVEHHRTAPEVGETQNVEQSQPEPQVEELEKLMMAEVEDDGTTLLVPDGGDPEAYFMGLVFGSNKQQDAAEILPCPAPATPQRQIDEDEANVMLFAGEIEHDLQSVEEVPEFGETQNVQPEPQIVPASFDVYITPVQVQDSMITEVEDGDEKGFWDDLLL